MPVNDEARALMAQVIKEHGEGAIVLGSEMVVADRFTTGSLSLDIALGGGWPANHWIEVIGEESHGKTAIVLKTIAANQARDPEFTTMWLAAEHYDTDQAAALGVDNDRVLVVSTQAMEYAYETILKFAESRAVDCIVLDSYPALIADDEAEKDMDEAVVAVGARLTGKFFRKAGAVTKRDMKGQERPFLGIIINQYRDMIGGFSPQGTPKTTPGGKAKNYAFYVRVEVRRAEWIDEARPGKGKTRVGQVIKVKTIKNKSAAPQQIASVDFYFRDAPVMGFTRGDYDVAKEIQTMGVLYDVIKRSGAYFYVGDKTNPTHRWRGKEAMLGGIREDLGLQEDLKAEILDRARRPDAIIVTEEDMDAAATVGTKTVTSLHTEAAS
jgi:recombination protein RecA